MIRKTIFLCGVICAMASAGGCASQPAPLGGTVRSVMENQIYDYEAATNPAPDAIEGGDPYRLDAALELYRTDGATPQDSQAPFPFDFGN